MTDEEIKNKIINEILDENDGFIFARISRKSEDTNCLFISHYITSVDYIQISKILNKIVEISDLKSTTIN